MICGTDLTHRIVLCDACKAPPHFSVQADDRQRTSRRTRGPLLDYATYAYAPAAKSASWHQSPLVNMVAIDIVVVPVRESSELQIKAACLCPP